MIFCSLNKINYNILMNTIQIWLVRHGQTEENIKKILCGQNGGHLTGLGVRQALELGKRLSQEQFLKVYCSDLDRTVKTFEAISQFLIQKPPVQYTPMIREKHAGVLDGKSLDIPKQMATQQKLSIREFRPEQGENWIDVNTRALQFLEILAEAHLQEKIPKQVSEQFEEQKEAPKKEIIPQEEKKQQMQPPQKVPFQQLQLIVPKQATGVQQKPLLKLATNVGKQLKQSQEKKQPVQVQAMGQFEIKGNKPKIVQKLNPTIPQKAQSNASKIPNGPKILVVTHGGFIMEFINMVLWIKEKKAQVYNNNSSNCSITIISISKKAGYKSINDLEIDILLSNDNAHCAHVK